MSPVVSGVEVFTADLPFRFSFDHALAQRDSSTNVFVKVTLSDATTGFGEGVPRAYVTGETVDSAVSVLCERYAPALVGCRIDDPESVPVVLDRVAASVSPEAAGPPGAAWCALELALLDAAGRLFGVPVRRWVGPLRAATLHYDAVVPFTSRRALSSIALAARMLGVRRLKVKVGVDLDEDLYRLRRLRRWLGGEADLRVDANCAWTVEGALVAIDRMRRYGISLVEQPVAADDIEGLCRLTAACPETIAVDESLRTPEEARELIEARACDAFNIRVSKCGGLLSSTRIAALASAAGLLTIVGAHVGESGILSAASRHLAASVAPRYLEGSAGRLLLAEDITRESLLPGWGGRARAGDAPGLGVRVRDEVLDRQARLRRGFGAAESGGRKAGRRGP